jgi:hypothetical protein
MKTLRNALGILAAFAFLISGCSAEHIQQEAGGQSSSLKAPGYGALLGKSLGDQDVLDFISNNACIQTGNSQLCKNAGMALWFGSDQHVERVYLYLNNVDDILPYGGELPFGLKYYDSMLGVEYKLRKYEVENSLQSTGMAGLPDEAASPDHLHYWAIYKRLGLTVIYNFAFADEDATIYAVMIYEPTTG